jgi:AraC-like DNA-binding protein
MSFELSTIHSIGKIAVTILVLLAIFLVTVDSKIKTANRMFAAFLLLVAFDMCGLFIYEWLIQHPYIDMLRRSSAYLQMPMMYFYVKLICFKDVQLKVNFVKHSAVFVCFWGALLLNFVWQPPAQQIAYIQDPNRLENVVFSVVGELQYFFYIFLIFKALATYKINYQANFANHDASAYKWLFQFTCISVGAHLFALSKDFMVQFAQPSTILFAYLVVSLSVLTVICWIVLKALHHPSITRGIKTESTILRMTENEQNINTNSHDKQQTKRQVSLGKISADVQRQINVLNDFMKTHEPYLEPDLSIERLASLQSTDTKALSALINNYMGTNFFTYVNTFRIQKAKIMLVNPQNSKHSVLHILYEVGFNSKSSFNTAFKKHTGQTPTAYRKNAANMELLKS